MRIEYNFTKVQNDLKQMLEDQVPFAASLGMRRALFKTRDHVKASMDDHIEGGPTPFTRRGMRVITPTKYDPYGVIYFFTQGGDPSKSRGYMQELMYSGRKVAINTKLAEPVIRNMKRFAPTMLTPRGNISRRFYKMARTKGHKQYFIGVPKPGKKQWAGNENLVGIWRRDKETGKLNMMVSLKRSARQQRKTFPAPEIAQAYIQSIIADEMRVAYIEALRTADFSRY